MKQALFQAGGPLSPDSSAFEKSIYLRTHEGSSVALGAVNYVPQVIGSPRLSGKTTQVNTIVRYHEKLAGPGPVLQVICEIPKATHPMDETSLRSLLATVLCASPNGSLRDILSSSRLLGTTRCVLAVINSERIATNALHWLLSGFKAVHDDYALRRNLKTQLLIDGSFSVDTLTSGPDSDYPLPQTYPPEFSRNEQSDFLTSRLAQLKLKPTDSALQFLWERTVGDKYLTQAVGRHFAADTGVRKDYTVQLDTRELRTSLEHDGVWRELFEQSTNAIGSVVLDLALRYESAEGFIDQLSDDWESLPLEIKAMSYDGGLVRRTGHAAVALRAPLITESLQRSLRRARCSLAFLHSSFSISGVSEDERPRAIEAMRTILQVAARDELVTIHVGQGEVIRNGVEVKASALEGGSYTAVWSMPIQFHPEKSKVWALLWTVVSAGGRRTDQQIFGIQKIG